LHLNVLVENIDDRVRIMPVDRVDGSWTVVMTSISLPGASGSVCKERIHLLSVRCGSKSEGKDKYRADELLHALHRFSPFRDMLRQPT
jgi:hypothetical protein